MEFVLLFCVFSLFISHPVQGEIRGPQIEPTKHLMMPLDHPLQQGFFKMKLYVIKHYGYQNPQGIHLSEQGYQQGVYQNQQKYENPRGLKQTPQGPSQGVHLINDGVFPHGFGYGPQIPGWTDEFGLPVPSYYQPKNTNNISPPS